ncbi:unnamed protein product [Heligmosomoides polygyrus]|uniref:Reverse transcriptase n=1 Tax=Heligmosomoides polygyrus TaxID=6339 RepID=A0A183GJ61_HELPZ|nr:unnamed protein product [Heligmosomoides polygyrus]
MSGTALMRATHFKYLGSVIACDGSLTFEVNSRVRAAWSKWRSITGVKCAEKISDRLKSMIYRTEVRPIATYGAECWPATKEAESRLGVMETKMLRWTAGGVAASIADKLREARLWSYGNVFRTHGDTVRKIGLNIIVPGNRPQGRPRQR